MLLRYPAALPSLKIHARKIARVTIDLAACSAALWLAYFLRFDASIPQQSFKQLVFLWPWVAGMEFGLLVWFRLTQSSWRFVGLKEAQSAVMAAAIGAVVLLFLRVAVVEFGGGFPYAGYLAMPLGVIAMNAALMFLLTTGVRVLRRVDTEHRQVRDHGGGVSKVGGESTLLIGAGSAGHLLAREIRQRPNTGIRLVGFVDDDSSMRGMSVDGLRVCGGVDDLSQIVARTGATQALITISNVRGEQVRRIKDACDGCGIQAKIIPPICDLVDGQLDVGQIREVRIEDLLGREPVDMDSLQSAAVVRGKVVMVTGAGGSIGSELCRQILAAEPATLLLVEQAENSLYQIHRELEPLAGDGGTKIVPAIADVCDEARMRELFLAYTPHVVFHAAAHKHVPMMEANPCEAIKNNALGTRTVADLAAECRAEAFILISTDKAVNPSSVMGATKRLAEIYLQALQRTSETRFVSVRFGNVLGSAGSVIPLFREQIAKGGPVTVTHPEMVRYFMTIPEACQLVLEAGAIGRGGEVFVLDMGEPIKIVDLAEQMIRLSGLLPGEDIEVEFSGMRPGEKLYEELAFDNERMLKTRCAKIFLHKADGEQVRSVGEVVDGIVAALADPRNVRMRLGELVPSYRPVRKLAASVGRGKRVVAVRPARPERGRRMAT